MVTKVYKVLTKEQIKRGVIFSSTLSTQRTEQQGDITHEIFITDSDSDKETCMRRLLSDRFFNKSHFKFNIVRRL